MIISEDITFVYLGKNLPKYAVSSMKLADDFSGSKINFIGNSSFEKNLRKLNLNFICIEDFYDKEKFNNVTANVSSSHLFRDGFWLRTLERFFVLEQFFKEFKKEYVFHAELDQLLFRCDLLISKLNTLDRKGIYLPFVDSKKAVASVFYCNDLASLESLTDFATSCKSFSNEMELLALWASNFHKQAVGLPTLSTELSETVSQTLNVQILESAKIGGLVDAAEIGQWIGGNDPRNVPLKEKPFNRFNSKESVFFSENVFCQKMDFFFDQDQRFFLNFYGTTQNFQIYNLHIHSKIHSWILRAREPKKRLLNLANGNNPVVIFDSRLAQIKYHALSNLNQIKSDPKLLFTKLHRVLSNS